MLSANAANAGLADSPLGALAAKGFRPFFLLAAAFAALMVPIWILVLRGKVQVVTSFDPMLWHAHEMIFGFAVAVVAGFLLTAVGNWTKRETAVGPWLIALALIWGAGRVAMSAAQALPSWAIAVADLAFVPALIATLARPLIASKNRRNFVMLGILTALFLANVAFHADANGFAFALGWARRGIATAVDVVLLIILVIAGRVFPMFTRNATRVESIRSHPALDRATLAAMALLTIFDAFDPTSRISRLLPGLVAAFALARAVHWGAWHARNEPLLWILHAGYAWIPIGLGLRFASAFVPSVHASWATHALTVGAIGSLTLGMMARVTLGHTGRVLATTRVSIFAFVLISSAALVRVVLPMAYPASATESVLLAAILWSAAFTCYLVAYAPMLFSPRVDGAAG